jgi:MFS transporter, FSR family, fosmidomycin resistance protein
MQIRAIVGRVSDHRGWTGRMTIARVREEGASGDLARDVAIVGTVSAAHFCSHFYQFTLPLLFPRIVQEYGVGFTELGLVVTVFYASSGLAQTAAGFLVDHVGPARVLAAGLGLLAASMALVALVPSFWLIYPAAALAGLGNSVFHPADYSIMSRRVEPSRVGRAFAVHALSGTLGYAAAPAVMVGLASLLPWRGAVLLAALAGGLVFLLVLAKQRLLAGPAAIVRAATAAAGPAPSPLAAFRHPAVLVCFSFFFLMAAPTVGLSGFATTALGRLFDTPVAVVAAALTINLVGSGMGVMLGGILADRTGHHERIVAAAVFVSAVVYFAVGVTGFGALALAAMLGMAGFSSGIAAPSRDMLVRSAAATSATTGKVFGFVYSGFDLGSAAAPPLLGFLLDHGHAAWVMPTMAFALVLVILSALGLKVRHEV